MKIILIIFLVLIFSCFVKASDYEYSLSRNYFYLLSAGAWSNPNQCAIKAGFELIPPPYEFSVPCSLENNTEVKCYAYIAINNSTRTVMVGFRGTKCYNLSSCPEFDEENRHYALIPFVVGQIDEFFHNAFMNLYKNYYYYLQPYKEYTNLWLTGHSLGAAEATATAVYITKQSNWSWTPDSMTIYLYGCPRVGDETFASYIDDNFANYFRVNHGYDPIPHIPTVFQGFYAASVEVWYLCPMFPASPYVICDSQGLGNLSSCSDVAETIILENALELASYHLNYYELDITIFAESGCCGCEPTWVQSTAFPCDCYKIFDTPKSWAGANLDCGLQNVPSTLVTIDSAFENSYINTLAKQLYPICTQFFIGFNNLSGTWAWAGDQTNYTNWKTGSPGNAPNNKCAVIQSDGTWLNVDCASTNCYICKINKNRVQSRVFNENETPNFLVQTVDEGGKNYSRPENVTVSTASKQQLKPQFQQPTSRIEQPHGRVEHVERILHTQHHHEEVLEELERTKYDEVPI